VLSEALAQAWEDAGRIGGSSPDDWRWARYHQTNAVHTLATLFPHRADELNPPRVGIGGDSDTVQVATYAIQPGSRFAITGLPVYRQVVDFADRHHARYVIPGGSSGRPGTPHSSDQMDLWQTHQLIAMREVTQ
jgi:penicillin amidase